MARFLAIFLLILLVGCTTPPDKLSSNERKQIYRDNQEQLQFLHQWQMSGRFAIHYERGGDALNVDWIQYYRDYGVKLTGPMNIGAAYLVGNKDGVTYRDGKGNVDHAPSPEAILQAHTGYLLPISSLRFWLIGMPDPAMINDVTLNPQGYPIQMRQGPWTIEYGYFRPVGDYLLPHRLNMKHRDFSITLNIYDWELKNIQPVASQFKMKQPAKITPIDEENMSMQQTVIQPEPPAPPKDPAKSSSLAGESFPPKQKSTPTAKQQPQTVPKTTQQPRSQRATPPYQNDTPGMDMTDTSMHP